MPKAALPDSPQEEDEEGYGIRLKTFPTDIYADHVATFVYEIKHRGVPVDDLEPIDGHDRVLASWNLGWFNHFEEFEFAQSRRNLGGPAVGVSVVLETPGTHVVFAQFKHQGKIGSVDTLIDVRLERKDRGSPTDYNDRAF